MSFHVSTWSVKNPVAVLVLFLFLTISGIFAFLQLGIDEQPNIDISVVQVTINQRGAGPEELESQVTKKVEDAVSTVNLIDNISSTVADGRSITTIEFELEADANQATNDVRNAIAQIRQDLPADIDEPIVQKLEFAGGTIMTYVVSSANRTVEELTDLVDRRIARDLVNVSGVARVNRIGGKDREVRVDLNPSRLQAYGITATEVNNQIRDLNVNLSGGRSEIGDTEKNVRTLGSAETVGDLANYPIVLSNGDTVPLHNLGDVRDAFAEPRQSASFNNQPVVGFSILRSTGSTLVTVAQNVERELVKLKETLPPDINIDLVFTRATAIKASYEGTIGSLVIGSILTIISVGLFLKDWRATLITAVALPLSIIPTFLVMQSLNYTLNGMTLLALALAMGNLVDDAICMIENIDQHLSMGKKPYQAAMDAAREIGLAVVATTATIVAVFLPVAFMGGIPGQFFQPFGVTVAVATMFSTLVATTMTPMLSAYLLKSKPLPKKNLSSRKKWQPYRSIISWALRNKITTLIIAITFFIGSLQLVPYIPTGLFTDPDRAFTTIEVELPPGSTIRNTELVTAQITDILADQPEVKNVLVDVGGVDVNTATLYVNLIPKEERIPLREFQSKMRSNFAKIPGARINFRSGGAGGSSKDLTIILKSDDGEILNQTAQRIEAEMRQIPGLVEISSSASLVKPEIIIQPNLKRAADLGVSVTSIARTASLATLGDNDFNLAKFNLSDRQIPIRIQINPQYRGDIETLRNLKIPSQNGSLVSLGSVADIRLGSGPAEIKRYNRQRQVELGANLDGVALGDALSAVNALPSMNPLPPEVSEEPAGDAEIMRDIFTRFLSAVFFAIASIYTILVLLYSNFLYPLAILVALPLSVGGALMGLLVTQKELGLFALIGIVLLLGLVTKNAILLVDFALMGKKEGKTQFRSVVDAGVSRLRPIVMTSISTIAGMIPIALAWGADGEVRSPMAIAVIGGFTTSTLLTLIVVPVTFCYVDNIISWFSKLWKNEEVEKVQKVLTLEETLHN